MLSKQIFAKQLFVASSQYVHINDSQHSLFVKISYYIDETVMFFSQYVCSDASQGSFFVKISCYVVDIEKDSFLSTA